MADGEEAFADAKLEGLKAKAEAESGAKNEATDSIVNYHRDSRIESQIQNLRSTEEVTDN